MVPRWVIGTTLWVICTACMGMLLGCSRAAPPAATQTPPPTATPAPTPTHTLVPTSTPTPVARSEPAAPIDPYVQAKRLGRGVNLGNALEAPREGEWGMVLEEEYFRLIKAAGFDTIRVPIRWSAHALSESPYTVDEAFFRRVDWVIDSALKQGLNVVINMHHYQEIFQDASKHRERFIGIWKQIAARYRYMPDNLYLEPLNEPNGDLTSLAWNGLLKQVIAAIRQVDGVHTLIIDGAEWGGIKSLMALEIPADEKNVICSFHYYEPFLFTHQGADWVGKEYHTVGVQWPGPPQTPLTPLPAAQEVSWIRKWFEDYNRLPVKDNPAGPEAIVKELDWAVRAGQNLGRPLWLGEFGAYSNADMQSRANWTTFVRQEAEARGFSWAYWEFGAGFGVYDRETHTWREKLLHALIPDK